MTPQDFKNAWTGTNGDSLIPLSEERFKGLQLRPETTDFLRVAGLPENAAPYLTFIKDTSDLYDGINKLTKQYEFIDQSYEKFVVIGSDGSGNPIAINTAADDRIEWIDHEDFSSCYLNASIHHLADTLVAYRDFVRSVLENHENAFMNSDFTDDQFKILEAQILSIDEQALAENNFWKAELDTLQTDREYYRNNPQG
jgi:hypothetical protein